MIAIHQGHVIDKLREMPAGSVHACITSPPYFGLRNYDLPPVEWPSVRYAPMPGMAEVEVAGCAEGCQHEWGEKLPPRPGRGNKPGDYSTSSLTNPERQDELPRAPNAGQYCRLCGGWKGSLGLEPHVEMYVGHLVAVLREVKRVLRDDGTLWLNLGSSYASGGMSPNQSPPASRVPACDTDGTERSDFQGTDRACLHSGDEHQGDCQSHQNRIAHNDPSLHASGERPLSITHDSERSDSEQASLDVSAHGAQESTNPSSTGCVVDACALGAKALACPSMHDSYVLDVQESVRMGACTSGTALPLQTLAAHTLDKGSSFLASDSAIRELIGSTLPYYTTKPTGYKPKDLIMIPSIVALALQADGWYLRSAPPWIKGNAMPESVRDRCTTAHESWFQLNKSARYFADMEAVRVASSPTSAGNRREFRGGGSYTGGNSFDNSAVKENRTPGNDGQPSGRNRRTSDFFFESLNVRIAEYRAYLSHLEHIRDNGGMLLSEDDNPLALVFNTKGFKGAHFATFNTELIAPLVKCSTSERGCCPECGKGWVRVVERTGHINKREPAHCPNNTDTKVDSTGWAPTTKATDDWRPTCTCDAGESVPATVLDPFSGAGTTLLVADRLGRDAIGIELSEEYVEMSRERIYADGPMFAQVEVTA